MRVVVSNMGRVAAVMAVSIAAFPVVSGWNVLGKPLGHPSLSTSAVGDPRVPDASDGRTLSHFGRLLKPLDYGETTPPSLATPTSTAPVEQVCPFKTRDGDDGSRRLQSATEAIISNGVIKLGVNPFGNLNVNGTIPVFGGTETRVGLRFIQQRPGGGQPLESEATSFGCECEVR